MTNLCDTHSHFLPGIDDGCQTPEESCELLRLCYENGVTRMFSTSHYYPKETVEHFLKRRNEAAKTLVLQLHKTGYKVPAICLGAEVAYHEGIVYEENLKQLCLGKSHYMLLEMPFEKWSQNVLKDIQAIINVRGVTPVIAHIERFLQYETPDLIEQLTSMNVIVQMNCEYILDKSTFRKAKKMITSGMIDLLGSDTHNLTKRKPNIWLGHEALCSSGLADYSEEMNRCAADLFEKAIGK